MLGVLVSNEYLQRDSYTFLPIFWESPSYHLDHPVPQTSYEIYCPDTFGPSAPGNNSAQSAIMMKFADMLHNTSLTVLLPWQQTVFQTFPDNLGFPGHLWSSILIFANGANSFAWSSKHINL